MDDAINSTSETSKFKHLEGSSPSNSQLCGNLHKWFKSRHKRANFREATAGYESRVRHQTTWIVPFLASWK